MSSRECAKCKTIFKYPSILKAHMKKSFHCLSNDEDINNHIINNKIIINKTNDCEHCNSTFTRNSDLRRHKLNSKCGNIQNTKLIINKDNKDDIDNLTIKQLKLLYPNKIHELLQSIK